MESDFTLIEQFVDGEERAFEQLVTRHQKVVYYMALRIVGNHDDAADITQQAFMKAFQEIRKFKRQASFRTWLCKIAVNLSLNHLKRSRVAERYARSDEEPDQGDAPLETLLKRERDRRVRRAIGELPERQRLTLILRCYHLMSHKEIGQILGITENNSRANYFHALKNLKARLIEGGGINEV